jgi:hypothetical protein
MGKQSAGFFYIFISINFIQQISQRFIFEEKKQAIQRQMLEDKAGFPR